MKGIALVTGASRGIGRAVALRLSSIGYSLWLNYRQNERAAADTLAAIEKEGGEGRLLRFDVTDPAAAAAALEPLLEKGCPDVLVNNAGITRDGMFYWMPPEDWKSVLSTTLDGFYNVTRPVVTGMLKRRSGRIITISSIAGLSGLPGQTNYSAAKAGVIGAMRSLAREVARRGILVNVVAPGFVETEMIENLPKDEILPRIPAGRFGTPEDVAGVVAFLCGEDSGYITGQVLPVDGGIHM